MNNNSDKILKRQIILLRDFAKAKELILNQNCLLEMDYPNSLRWILTQDKENFYTYKSFNQQIFLN
jgi:hypothetical protein